MSRNTAVTLPPTSGIHVGIIMDGNGRWAAARGRNLHLRVAIDYSSRDGIIRAAERYAHQLVRGTAAESLTREDFGELLAEVHHDPRPVRDVDLLIRTGGEQRLSDFMLWECA